LNFEDDVAPIQFNSYTIAQAGGMPILDVNDEASLSVTSEGTLQKKEFTKTWNPSTIERNQSMGNQKEFNQVNTIVETDDTTF